MTLVKAVKINAPAIRVRAWLIEALYSAFPAEQMFGLARTETVIRNLILSAEQLEILVRHENVQISGHRTDRAVAIEHFARGVDFGAKTDRATMATARDDHSTVTDLARLRG